MNQVFSLFYFRSFYILRLNHYLFPIIVVAVLVAFAFIFYVFSFRFCIDIIEIATAAAAVVNVHLFSAVAAVAFGSFDTVQAFVLNLYSRHEVFDILFLFFK